MTPTIAPDDVLAELVDWLRKVAPRRKEGQARDFALFDMAGLNLQELNAKINEAADAITGLQDRVERLERALRPFAREADNWLSVDNCKRIGICSDPAVDLSYASFTVSDLRKARAALIGEGLETNGENN